MRFWNHDIDRNLEGVLATIAAALGAPPPGLATLGHPPPSGEGFG
jgi:very-short-patch-repair endonuclease